MKGLLFTQGVSGYQPLRKDRRQRLEELQTGDGRELPKHQKAQINRELDRLDLLLEQIAAVESERNSLLSMDEQPTVGGNFRGERSEDPLGTRLSYKKLITGAQVLGAKIAPLAPQGAAVGILLPNSAGVAVTFFALQTTGRVAAMLNFTAGSKNVVSACKAAEVSVVLTVDKFRQRCEVTVVGEGLHINATERTTDM